MLDNALSLLIGPENRYHLYHFNNDGSVKYNKDYFASYADAKDALERSTRYGDEDDGDETIEVWLDDDTLVMEAVLPPTEKNRYIFHESEENT